MRRRPTALGIALLLLLAGPGALAAPPDGNPPGTLAERSRALAELRSEVELLDARLRTERGTSLSVLRGLERRKSEIEALLDAERLRADALADRVARAEQEEVARSESGAALTAAVRTSLAEARRTISEVLPYRREARLALLTEIDAALSEARLSAEAAAIRLWRVIEDEIMLTGQVERSELPLVLAAGEGPRLVDVVRVGMVTLYTRLDQEHYGRLVRSEEGWQHEALADPQDVENVAALFQSLDRQIREGAYVLPLPGVAAKEPEGGGQR